MKDRLLRNWHPMRFLQLAMGAVFLVQAVTRHDMVALGAGLFFGAQAVFNIGCCGVATPSRGAAPRLSEDTRIDYEEIT